MGSHLDWGSVPAWAGVGVSFFALISAVFGAVQAIRAYRLQRRAEQRAKQDLEKRHREERSAQAAKVSVWISQLNGDPGTLRTMILNLRNASELPVYQVEARIYVDGDPRDSLSVPVLPPDTEPLRRPAPQSATDSANAIELIFTDSAGVVWRRTSWGELQEVEPKGG